MPPIPIAASPRKITKIRKVGAKADAITSKPVITRLIVYGHILPYLSAI